MKKCSVCGKEGRDMCDDCLLLDGEDSFQLHLLIKRRGLKWVVSKVMDSIQEDEARK